MKAKSTKAKAPKGEAVRPEVAIATLKEEILEHVRLLASGRIMTAFPIVDRGKQLIALEAELSEAHGEPATADDF